MRRALDRHGAADMDVGGLDLAPGEAERGQHVEIRPAPGLRPRSRARSRQKSSPSVHLLKTNLMSKAVGSAFSIFSMISGVKPLALRVVWLMAGAFDMRAVADRIGLDLGDVGRAIAEHAQRLRHGAVDDLEIAAAGELLELDQREIRLDAGGVAVHDEADGAGRRDHGRLGVAEAVLGAERERAVPGALGMVDEPGKGAARRRAGRVVEPHRRRRELLIAGLLAMGGAAMVADHPQHVRRGSSCSPGRRRAAPPSRPRSRRRRPS